MSPRDDEEERLRSAALQNAQTILLARRRAEEELVRAKEALEARSGELAQALAVMRATLESTTDGILVTDDDRQVTGFNKMFVRMWSLPREVAQTGHQEILALTSRRLPDPAAFLADIDEVYALSPPESYHLLELTDGRVIERFSRIQVVDGANVGRVWSFRDITSRRRAEEGLRKQSEWLRVTLSSIGDAVITTDAQARVTSLNPVAEAMIGWSDAEARDRPLEDVFHIVDEDGREPGENPAARALREGRIVGLTHHTTLVTRSGQVRAIDDSAAPIRDEHGKVLGVVLVFRDITEGRRAERALAVSEERLRLALEAGRMGVWDWNIRSGELSWSDSLEPLHGLEPGTFAGTFEAFNELIHPEDRATVAAAIEQAVAEGSGYDIEFRNVWPDGSTHWIAGKGKVFRGPDGRPERMIGVGLDVTRRRQSEESARFLATASAALVELTDSSSTLQKLAHLAVPTFADWCAVDVVDADGALRRVAAAHADPARVILVQQLDARYPARPGKAGGRLDVLGTGEPDWMERVPEDLAARLAAGDEQRRILEGLASRSYITVPLMGRTRALGVLTFGDSESGRILDAEDLRTAEELARRAVLSIENAELLIALRETDQRKDEFLAMLAHELRNPLAPIANATQVVRVLPSPPPELKWAVDVIERQVHQMTRLVDDLLDVSRITRGRIELRIEQVEVATIVNMAVEACRPLLQDRGHQLELSVPAEPIVLEADPTRLTQVLLNLLTNAAKYMDPGGKVELAVRKDGAWAEIRVRDEGMGISPDMLTGIFEMFSQEERSLEHSRGGLGIGLTLARRLVELHGGRVEARSKGRGHGSEFTVVLPLATAYSAAVAVPGEDGGRIVPSVARRILVVDDNRDAAESLAKLLTLLGHDVDTAHDGLAAIAKFPRTCPDVVLLDLGMPRLDGYDTARRMRLLDGGATVFLVALTGWGQEEDRRRSHAAGFDAHLTKPVDLGALQQVLARARAGMTGRGSREAPG